MAVLLGRKRRYWWLLLAFALLLCIMQFGSVPRHEFVILSEAKDLLLFSPTRVT